MNFYTCQYLDLRLSIDGYTACFWKVHLKTYFKPLHKFAYLDTSSNHPRHVFKGLIRTECSRYKRNSSSVSDYLHSLDLFKMRLLKLGYSKGFIDRNIIDYYGGENEQNCFRKSSDYGTNIVYTLISDKRRTLVRNVMALMKKASQGLRLDKKKF